MAGASFFNALALCDPERLPDAHDMDSFPFLEIALGPGTKTPPQNIFSAMAWSLLGYFFDEATRVLAKESFYDIITGLFPKPARFRKSHGFSLQEGGSHVRSSQRIAGP
jgi:hypothetical protein